MKKRQILWILLLCLGLSFCLCGCEAKTQEEPTSEAAAEESMEVSADTTVEESSEVIQEEEEIPPEPTTAVLNGKVYSLGIKALTVEDLTFEEAQNLPLFTELKEVTLTNMQLSYDEFQAVKELVPDITFHYGFDLACVGLPDIYVDENTEELDVSNMEVTNGEKMKDRMMLLPALTTLEMCDSGLTNEEMAEIREALPNTKVVWMLHMQDYYFRTDVVAYSTLVMWTPVPNPITSEDAEQFKYCTDLKALDLGHQAISDLSWLQYLPDLRVLILADNDVTDITMIGTLTELRYLELFGNYWIPTWEPLRNCTKLTDLNIGFVDISKDFSFLEPLTNMKHFWAVGCVFTGEQDQQIRSLIPEGCEYQWQNEKPEERYEPTGGGWRDTIAFWAQHDMFRGDYLDEIFE